MEGRWELGEWEGMAQNGCNAMSGKMPIVTFWAQVNLALCAVIINRLAGQQVHRYSIKICIIYVRSNVQLLKIGTFTRI